jgi:mRNA interferase RelE/StbE
MYKIIYKTAAKKYLDGIPKKDRERIESEINSLAENPRKHGVIKLKDSSPAEYRTKQGNYRIVFEIHDKILMILVIKVFIRGDEY